MTTSTWCPARTRSEPAIRSITPRSIATASPGPRRMPARTNTRAAGDELLRDGPGVLRRARVVADERDGDRAFDEDEELAGEFLAVGGRAQRRSRWRSRCAAAIARASDCGAAGLDRAVDERAAVERRLPEPLAQGVEEGEDAVAWARGLDEASRSQCGDTVAATAQEGGDERLLGVEVAVQHRSLRDARLGGELVDADGERALLVEHARRGVEDPLAGRGGIERLALRDRQLSANCRTVSGWSRCTEWPAPLTTRYSTCGRPSASERAWAMASSSGSAARMSVGTPTRSSRCA